MSRGQERHAGFGKQKRLVKLKFFRGRVMREGWRCPAWGGTGTNADVELYLGCAQVKVP